LNFELLIVQTLPCKNPIREAVEKDEPPIDQLKLHRHAYIQEWGGYMAGPLGRERLCRISIKRLLTLNGKNSVTCSGDRISLRTRSIAGFRKPNAELFV